MGRVRFTSRIGKWTAETEKKLDLAVLAAATDIHRGAGVLAPKLTHALANSGRVERVGIAYFRVIFGGGSVTYAKRRHYENRLHPNTLRYLERSGDSVARTFKQRYLRGI